MIDKAMRSNETFSVVLVFMLMVLGALFATLLFAAPASAQADLRYAYPQQLSVSPLGVNLQTGRFTHSVTDIAVGDLQLTRVWGDWPEFTQTGRLFGALSGESGWSHNFANGTQVDQNNYRMVAIAGTTFRYVVAPDGVNFVPYNRSAHGTLLVRSGSTFTLTTESGDQHQFAATSATPTANAVLSWTLRADGTRIDYSYDASWRILQVRSSRAYAIVFTYDGSGNIAQVCGFNIANTYLAPTAGCSGALVTTSYGYDGTGNGLQTVTDPAGQVVTITGYASQGGPLCITRAGSSTCAITNTYGPQPGDPSPTWAPPDVVRSQVTPGGGTWTYSYVMGADPLDVPIVPGRPRWSRSTMTDPNGNITNLRYDRGVLVEAATPAGITNYKYENLVYNGNGISFDYHAVQPSLVILPGGGAEYFVYDARGNVVQRSQWPQGAPTPTLIDGITPLVPTNDVDLALCCVNFGIANLPAGAIAFTQGFLPSYPAGNPYPTGCGSGPADARRCANPTIRIDANGQQTDYVYDAAHGGVLTETGPADANGIRPQTRYTYVQRTAWLRTSGGSYAASPYSVWLLASRSSCRTTAASGAGCAGGATDEVRSTYDYGPNSGPNNLLLRGMVDDVNGAALRTCYRYDARGNRISETRPEGTASLTSCP